MQFTYVTLNYFKLDSLSLDIAILNVYKQSKIISTLSFNNHCKYQNTSQYNIP